MGRLKIQLLGPLLVSREGQAIDQFDTEKTRALLAYLASEPDRPHRREVLAEILWPGRPGGAARANLRHALGHLRLILGDRHNSRTRSGGGPNALPFLLATRDTIQLNPAGPVWLDVVAFMDLLHGESADAGLRLDQLEAAVALYRGPFLEDLTLGDSAAFQEWLWLKRETFSQAVLLTLGQLVACYSLAGRHKEALHYARRRLELAPWCEDSHQDLMRLLALTGARAAALAQYETCRRLLREELDVEPGAATTRLYEQIRDGHLRAVAAPALPGIPHPAVRRPPFLQEGTADVEPPPIVARERELATLEGHLQQALDGRGSVVFVTGVAGQGKTVLLREFTRRAVATHSTLLAAAGNCYLYSGVGDPYVPFREIMAMLTGDVASPWSAGTISRRHAQRLWNGLPQTLQLLVQQEDALLATLVEGASLFDRALLVIPDHLDCLWQLRKLTTPKQPRSNPHDQTLLHEHVTGFLFELAAQHPLLLLLDDLQWADSASAALLFHLGRRLAAGRHRMLIVGAYRAEEVALSPAGERHPLMKVVNELNRLFGVKGVNLERTEQREGRRFVDTLLDTDPNQLGEAFRAALFRRTQGHPLFTVELLRAMQVRGDVTKNEAGVWLAAPALDWEVLPARVQAVIEERVDRLSPALQRILDVASVEGALFTAEIVAAVLGIAESSLQGQLAAALGRQHHLLQEQGEVQTEQGRVSRFQFRHFLFQDYVYKRLGVAERRLLHKEVAQAMEAIYGARDEEMAVQLAHHYLQAGEDRPALRYSIVAARRAARLYAGEETVQHASRAIAVATRIGSERRVLIDLYRDRGLAYERLGDFGRAYDDLDKARQIARAEKERRCECEALIDLGKLWASKDYRQSLHYFTQALDQARALGDPVVLAASLNWMGNWYANAEEPNEAIAYHHEALQLLQESDNRPELGHTLDLLGIASLLAADTRGSKSYFDQAIAHFRELGDRAALASSLTGRGNCGSGTLATVPRAVRPDVARRDFEEAIQIAREIRAPGAEAWADWSLAFVELVLGRFGTALALAEHGLQVATAIGHREWIVANRAALGVLYGEMFAFEEAQRHSQAALALAHELQSQHWINQTGGTLAALYLLQDDKSQAEQALAAVISPQTPMDTLHRRGCWARRAELALAQGDPDRAATIVDRLIQTAPHPLPGDVIPYLWLLQGKAQTALDQLEPALSWLHAAAEATRQGNERFLLWQIHGALAALYVKMDDLVAAAQARSLAEALIGELAATLSDKHRQQTYLTRAGSKLPLLP